MYYKKATLVCVCAVILAMMAATVIEKICGSQVAFTWIYHNPLFIAIWVGAAVSGTVMVVKSGMYRRIPLFTLHLSFLLILSGALITFLTAQSGQLHLRQSNAVDYFANEDMMRVQLPFSIRLDRFQIDYHAGTENPSDYSSYVTVISGDEEIPGVISMNHPLKCRGFVFYQSSYDADMEGSVLAVSHDPWGVAVSYAGYFMLLASMVGFFFSRQSGFRAALGRLGRRMAVLAIMLMGWSTRTWASTGTVHDSMTELYSVIGYSKVPAMVLVTWGIVLFVAVGVFMARKKNITRRLVSAQIVTAILAFAYLSLILGVRWFLQHHVPMASGYEMMMLIAWCAMLAACLSVRKLPVLGPMAFILAGFAMLVAILGEPEPVISPLMPVLSSPLLAIHVSCMMVAYTMFGLAALNGIMGLAVRNEPSSQSLADISMVILYPAVFLLTAGTFLGAIWANISWGSYWMWDPKETWALVTMMVYAFALHGASVPKFRNPRFLHIFTIVAFMCVLITYFGVNLLLGGMHSYA